MTYLQYARWRAQKKRELQAEITQDYQAKQSRRVFLTLQMYARYRQDKVVMDHMLTKAVQGVTKKRYFKGWKRQLDLHNGVKLLGYALQRAQISSAFRYINNYFNLQDACTDHLKTKSNLYYRLLTPFKAWHRHVSHKKLCKRL